MTNSRVQTAPIGYVLISKNHTSGDYPLWNPIPLRSSVAEQPSSVEALTRFIDNGLLPIDNNEAEREFQRHAKLRQASLFAGSVEGARRWAILLGVVRTAQKCGVDVESYLKWVFERRGSHRKKFAMSASELTPMAYRDSLADVRASA